MNIYIKGVGTHNKGAELMALAIRDHYASIENHVQSGSSCGVRDKRVNLVVDISYGTYEDRTREGFSVRYDPRIVGAVSTPVFAMRSRVLRRLTRGVQTLRASLTFRMMPGGARSRFGVIPDDQIDVVLDASGFSYSDQWGVESLINAAKLAKRWKASGKRIILMPQAFGPFELPGAAAAVRSLVANCDLVYARDNRSLKYLKDVAGEHPHVKLAPDFTNLLTPSELDRRISMDILADDDFVVIVPNTRMLDKVDAKKAEKYIEHLRVLIRAVQQRRLSTVMMFFDPRDAHFATKVTPDKVLWEDNPRILKAIIGRARVVIGSRFHALVCALTQGVPAVGSGWSHKYEMLFGEYGCPECLLDVNDSLDRIDAILDYVLNDSSRARLVSTLVTKEGQIRQRVLEMWQEIDRVIFGEHIG